MRRQALSSAAASECFMFRVADLTLCHRERAGVGDPLRHYFGPYLQEQACSRQGMRPDRACLSSCAGVPRPVHYSPPTDRFQPPLRSATDSCAPSIPAGQPYRDPILTVSKNEDDGKPIEKARQAKGYRYPGGMDQAVRRRCLPSSRACRLHGRLPGVS